ncbi:MAG: hypothetical protein H0V25_01815 [Solirubrobacterales bacterium]|nr:hypothetical protein [Solirubrobacterales bacterium]
MANCRRFSIIAALALALLTASGCGGSDVAGPVKPAKESPTPESIAKRWMHSLDSCGEGGRELAYDLSDASVRRELGRFEGFDMTRCEAFAIETYRAKILPSPPDEKDVAVRVFRDACATGAAVTGSWDLLLEAKGDSWIVVLAVVKVTECDSPSGERAAAITAS